jgi:hypothetical protein
MTTDDNVPMASNGHTDLIYPFSPSTFNTYMAELSAAAASQPNSPRFIQRTSSPSYQHIYFNEAASSPRQPPPPPYPPHLSTVMPIRTRSPLVQNRLTHTANSMHTAPPTSAPPPAPGTSFSGINKKRRRRNISGSSGAGQLPAAHGQAYPEFYALVKAGDSGSELYARPPSDHFYFKITDGKTEFI